MGRGGYGLLRLLASRMPTCFGAATKPIVGFSDGTLLLAQAARAGLASIHGPVVTQLGRLASEDHDALFAALEQPDARLLLSGLEALVKGQATGPLLAATSRSSRACWERPYLPDLRGAILFFEDVGERPYRLDRLLTQLELAGVFQAAAGLVTGEFRDCDEPADPSRRLPRPTRCCASGWAACAFPWSWARPSATAGRNHALPYGTRVALDADAGTLAALEGAVS